MCTQATLREDATEDHTDKTPIGNSTQIRLQTLLPLECRLCHLREGSHSSVQSIRPSIQLNPPLGEGIEKIIGHIHPRSDPTPRATRIVVLPTGKASTSQPLVRRSVKTSPKRTGSEGTSTLPRPRRDGTQCYPWEYYPISQ